jgi:hypothetical protein
LSQKEEQKIELGSFEKQQLKIARKNLWVSRFTALVALLTCLAIVVFNSLSQRNSQKAIEISTRSLQLAHRPYLSVSGVQFELREPLRHHLFMKLDLKNVGSVPANILNIEFKANKYLKDGIDEKSIFKPRTVFPEETRRFEVDFTFRYFGITTKGEEPGFEITVEYYGTDSSFAKYVTYQKYSIDCWREVIYIIGDSGFVN